MYPLDRLTQISVQKAKQFLNAGITSIEELAEFFPRKYYDFREVTSIRDSYDGRKKYQYISYPR